MPSSSHTVFQILPSDHFCDEPFCKCHKNQSLFHRECRSPAAWKASHLVPNQAVKQGKSKAKNPLAQFIIIENKPALQCVLSKVVRRFVIGCCHSDEIKEEAWGALHSTKIPI